MSATQLDDPTKTIIFERNWNFVRGAPALKFLPPEGPIEIAFAGRSNVGKSSLINALVNRQSLARTSVTPGRTQEINFFVPEGYDGTLQNMPPLALVDMPGYGFAQAPKSLVQAWTELVFSYLRGRSTLKRVFLLIDSRHGIRKNDKEVLALLDKAAVSYQIILTKIDKISKNASADMILATQQAIAKHPAAYPEIIATSAEKKIAIDSLRSTITQIMLRP